MPDDTHVKSVDFVRTFPWLRLGRAVGCALAPTQLLLAVATVLAWTLLVETLFAPPPRPEGFEAAAPRPWGSVADWNWEPIVRPTDVAPPVWHIGRPLVRRLFLLEGSWRTLTGAVVAYVLWTIAGVAIARSAAVQVCRDAGPSFRDCVQWSLRRSVGSLSAIATPLGGVLFLCVLIGVLSLMGTIPALGGLWLRLTAPLQMLLGLAAGSVLVLLPLLWPLMIAAVAVDGSDSFDAFSRSFSLVTSRFWTTFFLCLVSAFAAWIVASIADVVVVVGQKAVIFCAGVALGQQGEDILWMSIGWWGRVFVTGVLSSLFWTHATIIYLFLRQAVDSTPLDALAGLEDDMRFHEPYPVVGMHAVGQGATEPPSDETGNSPSPVA